MPALPQIAFMPPLIDATILSLQTRMPDQVAAFNANPANPLDITVPATYHFGIADEHSLHPFPQIEVAAVEGRFGRWALNHTAADHDPTLNVVIWLQGVTGQIGPVYRELLGLVQCAIEILAQPGAFGGENELASDNGIYWRLSELIPLETDDPERQVRTWLVPAFLQCRLEVVEQFG